MVLCHSIMKTINAMKSQFLLLVLIEFCFVACIYSCSDSANRYMAEDLIESAMLYTTTIHGEPIVVNGSISKHIVDSLELSKENIELLLDIIQATGAFNGGAASCFEPEFGVVFRGVNKNPVSHMTVSIECGRAMLTDNFSLYMSSNTRNDIYQFFQVHKAILPEVNNDTLRWEEIDLSM